MFCTKAFNVRGDLHRHVKNVHNNLEEYECQICDLKFKTKTNLDVNMNKIHDNICM